MDEKQLTNTLKDKQFIEKLVKIKSSHELVKLLKPYGISASIEEIEQLKNIVMSVKKEFCKIDEQNDDYLQQISGGNSNIMKSVTKPLYYAGYGIAYATTSIPIVGYTVYYSIKDAIRGYYDNLKD